MQTFDLDKLMKLVDNKFHLVVGIVERVRLLKRGVEAKVPRKNRDLITVAMEEMENDLLGFHLSDTVAMETLCEHTAQNKSMVSDDLAREEALAAQTAGLGLGSMIDRRPLSVPALSGRPLDEQIPDDAEPTEGLEPLDE
jgi:DNA-directed RNA polymerase subunit K/omega